MKYIVLPIWGRWGPCAGAELAVSYLPSCSGRAESLPTSLGIFRVVSQTTGVFLLTPKVPQKNAIALKHPLGSLSPNLMQVRNTSQRGLRKPRLAPVLCLHVLLWVSRAALGDLGEILITLTKKGPLHCVSNYMVLCLSSSKPFSPYGSLWCTVFPLLPWRHIG